MNKFDIWAIKIGFWFGILVVKFLEIIFPSLRDRKENLHGIKDPYLKQ